jgi:hypothetical protein
MSVATVKRLQLEVSALLRFSTNIQSEQLAAVILVGLSLATLGCRRAPLPAPTLPAPVVSSGTVTPSAPAIPATVLTPESTGEEQPGARPTIVATPQAPGPVAASLIREYIAAGYRPIAVLQNPYAPYSIIVVTERSRSVCGSPEEPVRCRIDDTCGATTTSPVCYFFMEPGFDGAADPATQYVARWPDAPTNRALVTGSLRFINARTVEFTTYNVESPSEPEQIWWLDLVTGAAAQLDRPEP